jgi:hypothetical protein
LSIVAIKEVHALDAVDSLKNYQSVKIKEISKKATPVHKNVTQYWLKN